MSDNPNLIEWTVTPRAVWSKMRQGWYPRVRCECNGAFYSEHEYIIGFEDEATAKTFARDFAKEESARIKSMAESFLGSLSNWRQDAT